MQIDRIEFYVDDAKRWRDWFVNVMGCKAIATGSSRHTHTEVVSSGEEVIFVLSSPLTRSSPIAEYLRLHPSGVGDIAFRVKDIEAAIERAIATGAKIQQPIQQKQFPKGSLKWCKIIGEASLCHTLIERNGLTPLLPQSWIVQKQFLPQTEVLFTGIDHMVLNVPSGNLEHTVSWYERVFGFQRKQTFTIQTDRSALYSQVMVHPDRGVQFPVNEPMSANSQIQEFLDVNRGAGIQHIALKTAGITKATEKLRSHGLSFLAIPHNYYTTLKERFTSLNLSSQEWKDIIAQQVLVDSQEGDEITPILLQIFTQPIFGQPTFFFELIERRFQAKGFGEGNFRALFEAIEREQLKRGSLEERI